MELRLKPVRSQTARMRKIRMGMLKFFGVQLELAGQNPSCVLANPGVLHLFLLRVVRVPEMAV